MAWEGLVADFTSVKPFPQAEDETNHMKVKAAVTNRSLKKGTRESQAWYCVGNRLHDVVCSSVPCEPHPLCTTSFTQEC